MGGATLVDDLRRATLSKPYDWIVIMDDLTLDVLAGAAAAAGPAEQNWFDAVLPVPRDGRPFLTRKSALVTLGEGGRLAVPRSTVCLTRAEVRAAAAELGFPVMLKADWSYAGNGVRKAVDPAALDAAFDALSSRLPLVVQTFIDGRIGSTNAVFRRGKLLAGIASFKQACFPAPFGPSSARQFCDFDEPLIEIAAAIGRASGFHGIAGIDWIVPNGGNLPLALEFNPRPVTSIHLGGHVGADIERAFAAMLRHQPMPDAVPTRTSAAGRTMHLFPQYVRRCLVERKWTSLLHCLGPGQMDWPLGEPLVLLHHVGELTRLATRQLDATARRRVRHVMPTTVKRVMRLLLRRRQAASASNRAMMRIRPAVVAGTAAAGIETMSSLA